LSPEVVVHLCDLMEPWVIDHLRNYKAHAGVAYRTSGAPIVTDRIHVWMAKYPQ
jgi:hypothetical protein